MDDVIRFADSGPALIDIGFACGRGPSRVMGQFHRHNELELNFLDRGAMTYLHGGNLVDLESGRVAVFWAAIPHQVIRVEPGTVHTWLTVPVAWFLAWRLSAAFAERVLEGEMVVAERPEGGPSDAAIFRRWHQDLKEGPEDRRRIAMLEVEARIRRMALKSDAGDGKKPRQRSIHRGPIGKVEKMSRFIAAHYTEPLTSGQVAAAAGLHPNYAMSLFKKNLGTCIVDYVTRLRVSHAQRLLATTDRSVLDVATASGFGSSSRFYVAFEQICACTPRAYRQSLKQATRG